MRSSVIMTVAALLCFLPLQSTAQTSIGFSDPSDIAPLLEYRLPDWGYRTGRFGLSLHGVGADGEMLDENLAEFGESLEFTWYGESEKRISTLTAGQVGNWYWAQRDRENEGIAIDSHLRGVLTLSGATRSYFSPAGAVIASTSLYGSYVQDYVRQDSIRYEAIQRHVASDFRLGAGIGRVRDVTPVIRAARLNERLHALGRESLSRDEVIEIAKVFARSGGYGTIFDRPERRFWRDVLDRLAAGGTPLTPFDIFYLREATFEQLGSRLEGAHLDAGVQWGHRTVNYSSPGLDTGSGVSDNIGPWMSGLWSHNLTLDRQLSLQLDSAYLWALEDRNAEIGIANLTARHLWALADRDFWITDLRGSVHYREVEFDDAFALLSRAQQVMLLTRWTHYIEDRLSLGPAVSATWGRSEHNDEVEEHRSWDVQLHVSYDLLNALF